MRNIYYSCVAEPEQQCGEGGSPSGKIEAFYTREEGLSPKENNIYVVHCFVYHDLI